jgi:hypothetical protein
MDFVAKGSQYFIYSFTLCALSLHQTEPISEVVAAIHDRGFHPRRMSRDAGAIAAAVTVRERQSLEIRVDSCYLWASILNGDIYGSNMV